MSRSEWRGAVVEALVASHHLLLVASQPRVRVAASADVTQPVMTLASRIAEPQQTIVAAMKRLQQFVPVNTEEELLIADARSVENTAGRLLEPERRRVLHRSAGGEAAVAASGGALATRAARVLVVDDEAPLRDMLQRSLSGLGYQVSVAEDGQQALDFCNREVCDLVVTDLNMPGLTGMDLLRLLKSGERTRGIPVIVVSAQDDLASVVQCIKDGAEDHITKPYEMLLLHTRVRASLERKRLRDLELDYLERVSQLTSAAEAVEHELYQPGSLTALAAFDDSLGRLTRVFDRMVSGLKSREDRLQRRLQTLGREMGETSEMMTHGAKEVIASPFSSGQMVAARYRIVGHIGNGGMGMVYRARDMELNEDVAIKVIRADLLKEHPDVLDRLKSEIRLARKISHPNVVRTHDLGEWEGTYFITMEFVRGITVDVLLDRRGRLTVESTLAIGAQLCDALAVAHDANIIHRDIKPANLLVDNEGVLKVMDFGIARSLAPDNSSNTVPGSVIGTPQYMAPEQLMGGVVDTRSELFTVGVVLYECLAGRPPFVADNATALMAQMIDGNCTKLSALVPDIPPRLERLIHRQLELRPDDRVGSARELAEALSALEQAPSIMPATIGPPAQPVLV